jgi:hypothetical protein
LPNAIKIIKSRKIKWAEHLASIGEKRNAYRVLVRKLGRPRHKWEDNIKMDRGEIGWGSVDWIHLA